MAEIKSESVADFMSESVADFARNTYLEHRIGDKRIIHLIQKWLKAGVLDDGTLTVSEEGTGQGLSLIHI